MLFRNPFALLSERSIALRAAFILSLASPLAQAHGEALRPVFGGVLGAFAGFVVAILLLLVRKPRNAWHGAGVLAATVLLFALAGGTALTVVGDLWDGKRYAPYAAANMATAESNALVHTACAGTLEELRREVATADGTALPQALRNCVVRADPQGEKFRVLLPLFARAQQLPAAPQPPFCHALSVLHESQRGDLLALVADAGLPLTCPRDADGWPTWFAGLQSTPYQGNGSEDQARVLAWLNTLQSRGVNLGERSGPYNECLLDRVVMQHNAEIVLLALAAGCDATVTPTGSHDWPAVARWAQRRFLTPGCTWGVPLSPQQIADISAHMPALRPEHINRRERANGRSLLHVVAEASRCEDGGAAVFAHLVAHGADLGLGDVGGDSFLSGQQSLHPALLAELRKLSDTQIERMAFPVDSEHGRVIKPLLESARASGNLLLVDLLCQRGIKGCKT